MRKNSLKKIFAALAMSAVATASIATVSVSAATEDGGNAQPTTAAETTAAETTAAETTAAETTAAETTAAETTAEETTEEVTEAPTESGKFMGFTKEEIEASKTKPVLKAPVIKIDESEAAGKTVEVTLSVSGTGAGWASSGIHLMYDNRLTLVNDAKGNPEKEKGAALGDLNIKVAVQDGGVFLATAGDEDYGSDGDIITYKFVVPKDAKKGDKYALNITYVDGDLFTNSADDQLMQAYAFTHAQNGYIEITGKEEPKPTEASKTEASKTDAPTKAPNNNGGAPATGVTGVAAAAAGLAVAAGAAFVLRKKED